MQFIRKYGTAFKIRLPVVKANSSDFAVSADWTPAAGDVKISKDGGGAANITTLPVAITMGNGAIWEFAVSATEAQAAEITITVVDAATKAVQDQALSVITFGNASAGLQPDWSDVVRMGLTALPNAAAEAAGGLYTRGTGAGQINQDANGRIDVSLKAILGTALTETAGQIAAAFKQFFNIATPAATMDHLILVDTVTTYTGNTKQTGDNFARLGAPAGASVSADIAAAKVDTAAIKLQTDKFVFTVANQVDSNVLDWKSATAPAMTGDAFARLGAPAGASVSADVAAVKADTAAVKLKTDNLPSDPADASDIAASFSTVNANLATVAGYIDTEVAAIKAKTDNLPAAPAATGDIPTANQNADALLDRAAGVETGWTFRQAMRIVLAALGGKADGLAGTTVHYRDQADSKNRITATVDSSGNRSAVTLDAS